MSAAEKTLTHQGESSPQAGASSVSLCRDPGGAARQGTVEGTRWAPRDREQTDLGSCFGPITSSGEERDVCGTVQ